MAASKVYAAYHNLWRIEESFRVMKSQLDARPVYLQKQETIWTFPHLLPCGTADQDLTDTHLKKTSMVPKRYLISYVTSELQKYLTENI